MHFRLFLLAFALLPLTLLGQSDTLTNKQIRKNRAVYIKLGLGSGYSYFRDFATSPLNYGGAPLNVSFAYLKADSLRETEIYINYYQGILVAETGESDGESLTLVFSGGYSRLYGLKSLSGNRWNVKVGGLADASMHLRNNLYLGNNGSGAEMFLTLFASGKIAYDMTRTGTKYKKLWFIKYKLNPRKHDISYRLNLAVINSTLRNGYAYNGQSYLVNDASVLDNYVFYPISGYRMSSCFDYTYFLNNSNALQLSYVWDAYKTGGDLDKFEMAHHTLKFSLLFSLK